MKATTTGRREVIYSRLSENPNEKNSVARGIADCEAFAERNASTIVEVFSDDDISAYGNKRRPGYEAMLEFIRDNPGGVDSILVPHTSRITRNDKQRATLFAELKTLNVAINSLGEGLLDLNTSNGAMVATMLGAFNTADSARKGELVRRVAQERADMGKAHSRVLYGWKREVTLNARGLRTEWHDVEDTRAADIVREIVNRLCDGETVGRIAVDLTARRIPTPGEAFHIDPGAEWVGVKPWTKAAVKGIATRPANIAKRMVKGEVFGDAEWPAIIEPVKHARVLARFTTTHGVGVSVGGREDRRYLLSYGPDFTCGVCGSELRAGRYPSNRGRRGYKCIAKGCVTRPIDAVDEYVAGLVIGQLAKPDVVAGLLQKSTGPEDVAALIAERDALQEESDALGDDMAAGLITRAQAARTNAVALPKIDALTARINRAAARKGSKHIGPLTVDQWWGKDDDGNPVEGGMDMNDRRRLLEACHVTVQILRSRPGRGFKPDTVAVTFNGHEIGVRTARAE